MCFKNTALGSPFSPGQRNFAKKHAIFCAEKQERQRIPPHTHATRCRVIGTVCTSCLRCMELVSLEDFRSSNSAHISSKHALSPEKGLELLFQKEAQTAVHQNRANTRSDVTPPPSLNETSLQTNKFPVINSVKSES